MDASKERENDLGDHGRQERSEQSQAVSKDQNEMGRDKSQESAPWRQPPWQVGTPAKHSPRPPPSSSHEEMRSLNLQPALVAWAWVQGIGALLQCGTTHRSPGRRKECCVLRLTLTLKPSGNQVSILIQLLIGCGTVSSPLWTSDSSSVKRASTVFGEG